MSRVLVSGLVCCLGLGLATMAQARENPDGSTRSGKNEAGIVLTRFSDSAPETRDSLSLDSETLNTDRLSSTGEEQMRPGLAGRALAGHVWGGDAPVRTNDSIFAGDARNWSGEWLLAGHLWGGDAPVRRDDTIFAGDASNWSGEWLLAGHLWGGDAPVRRDDTIFAGDASNWSSEWLLAGAEIGASHIIKGTDVGSVRKAVMAAGGDVTHVLAAIDAVAAYLQPVEVRRLRGDVDVLQVFRDVGVETATVPHSVRGSSEVVVEDQRMSWMLNNIGSRPLTIKQVKLVFPAGNGELNEVLLNDESIATGEPGTEVVVDTFQTRGQIAARSSRAIAFDFSETAAQNPDDYLLTVSFEEGVSTEY